MSVGSRKDQLKDMYFEEFWSILKIKLKQENEFKTLKYEREFKAFFRYTKYEELVVSIITSTGNPRNYISSNEFKGIWNTAKKYSRETRFVNKKGRLFPYLKKSGGVGKSKNVSYISKLIDVIVQDQNMG